MKSSPIWLLLAAPLLVCCTDEPRARRVLEEQGYADIELTGYAPWSCSNDDTFETGFRAKGPTGRAVTGAVCCGAFKNCTVRTR